MVALYIGACKLSDSKVAGRRSKTSGTGMYETYSTGLDTGAPRTVRYVVLLTHGRFASRVILVGCRLGAPSVQYLKDGDCKQDDGPTDSEVTEQG